MDKILGPVRLNMIRGTEYRAGWMMGELLEAFGKGLDIREQHVSLLVEITPLVKEGNWK